jgi:hypothetical protein
MARVVFAEQCAWRAVYVYSVSGPQWFRIGVDPMDGVKPQCFGMVRIGSRQFTWRFVLPYVSFRVARKHSLLMRLYQVSKRFWSKVDGRW